MSDRYDLETEAEAMAVMDRIEARVAREGYPPSQRIERRFIPANRITPYPRIGLYFVPGLGTTMAAYRDMSNVTLDDSKGLP